MEESKHLIKNSDLVQVSINGGGSIYFLYAIKVQRGIRGKTKGKADELLIMGIPKSAIERYCRKNNLVITNKAVYEGDFDHPLLFRDDNSYSWVYKRREDL